MEVGEQPALTHGESSCCRLHGPGFGPQEHSVLWNAMIHPLQNMTLKGVIWYQGECLHPCFSMVSAAVAAVASPSPELVTTHGQVSPVPGSGG